MSEQIREQVSAFLDGELPASETELLLKRLTRDAELRESFGRYGLIGEAMRAQAPGTLSRGFAARVNGAIDGEPVVVLSTAAQARAPRWWRPIAGAAVAAGVAAVAVVALQQRSYKPMMAAAPVAPRAAPAVIQNASREALSYTVPAMVAAAPAVLPEARLTNYVFAHSNYSSLLGQRNVLSGLIAEPPDLNPPTAPADHAP
jgi:sigma-E factor negative regulatory protein RseA